MRKLIKYKQVGFILPSGVFLPSSLTPIYVSGGGGEEAGG